MLAIVCMQDVRSAKCIELPFYTTNFKAHSSRSYHQVYLLLYTLLPFVLLLLKVAGADLCCVSKGAPWHVMWWIICSHLTSTMPMQKIPAVSRVHDFSTGIYKCWHVLCPLQVRRADTADFSNLDRSRLHNIGSVQKISWYTYLYCIFVFWGCIPLDYSVTCLLKVAEACKMFFLVVVSDWLLRNCLSTKY